MRRRRVVQAGVAFVVLAAGTTGVTTALSTRRAREVAEREERHFPQRLAELADKIEQKRRRLRIPGLSVVVVRRDRVVFLEGFGLRDVDGRLPVTPDTLFGIGSCTKAFTGMAAVISADHGKLSLDDHPRRFLPYFRLSDAEADAHVTLRDLLAHRTGLKAFDDEVWHKNDRLSREAVIRAVMLRPPAAPFRKEFLYNNVMYTAAGECLAKAHASTYERVIRDLILVPLGMKRSNVSLADLERDTNASIGYQGPAEHPKRERRHDLASVAPSGGINSTARDLGQWLRLMLAQGRIEGRRLVSEAAFRELVAPQMPIEGNASYGLGWEVGKTEGGHRFITHAGGAVGHAAHVWLSPDQDAGWAVLANINNTRDFRQMTQWVDTTLLP